jgi:U3 small nucleolar RNA-associated protein 19
MPAPKTIIKSTNQKQTKTNKTKNKNPSKLTLQQIKELESQIKLSQHQDLNPISDLINVLIDVNLPTSPLTYELIHTTLYALHRIFSTLIRQGRIHTAPISNHSEEALKVVTEWLKERYDEYTSCLLNLLKDNHEYEQLSLDGLTILMSLVRAESESSTSLSIQHSKENPGKDLKVPLGGFQSFTFKKLVKTFLIGSGEKDQEAVRKEVKVEFILRYFNYCDDIRYHFLKDAA